MTLTDVARHTKTAFSVVLSMAFLLFSIQLISEYIKVSKGMLAWSALFSIVILGIGEIIFIFLISDFYKQRAKKGDLLSRFFMVTSIQFLLLFAIEVLRVLVYLPVLRVNNLPFYSFWNPLNYARGAGGLCLGILFIVLTAIITKPPVPRASDQEKAGQARDD